MEAKSKGRSVHYLPAYRADMKINLHRALNLSYSTNLAPSSDFIKVVVDQRSVKSEEEIVEIEKAVNITTDMQLAAMRVAKPGMKEHEVLAAVQSVVNSANTINSFTTILSVRGEILHNHHYDNTLEAGQLLLCDCGAESGLRYAGDMTRTFPVNKTFTSKQRDVYQIVLDAKNKAAEFIRPGELYKTSHLEAARVIIEGLKGLGLMKGDTDSALAAGAHALFFPHGLGHMMGLDVHDMEALGENIVGYDEETTRADQFGLAFLRLGKRLKEGYVLTNEPGIYFIPQLIDKWKSEKMHTDFLNYDSIEQYKDFGGIRLEDDFLVTSEGSRILGNPPPINIADVERVRQENA
jgi:Xaa-Pro aminopeptidase